jgi:hypothetical protein
MRDCFQAGPKMPGSICTVETDCEAGSLCAIFGGGSERRCMKYCDDPHPCPTDQACYVPVLEQDQTVRVCGQVCDLLGQDCEATGQGCYPSARVTTMEKGVCALSKGGAEGATCTDANDCGIGLTCLSNDHKCHKLCDRNDGNPGCTSGTCQEIPGHTVTGVCK